MSTADDPSGPAAPADGDPRVPAPAAAAPRRTGRAPLVLAAALVAILAGGVLFLSGYSLGRYAATTPGTPAGEEELFRGFWDAYRAITERYALEVDRDALVEGAIDGMIEALDDPNSMYLTSEEYRRSLQGISGEFEGIGAEIDSVAADGTEGCAPLGPACRLRIVRPIEDSPAAQAGLAEGDLVIAIDGTSLDGLTLEQARDRVRGPRGSAVTLTILRGAEPARDVTIVRAAIVRKEVEARTVGDGRVELVRVRGFSDHTGDELEAALRAALAAGRTRLVLDLRGNPGGFVTAAREVASQFLADGTIYWQEDAAGARTETVARPGGLATDPAIRVVVLVDGGTASASEIVAGALQDRGRALLVGTRTYGKGTVQQWNQLENDQGGFRLTVATWLTPDERWINGTGLEPDVVVDPSGAAAGTDPVLERALQLLLD